MLPRAKWEIHNGDCLSILRIIDSGSMDLVYLDPPFFTQKTHRLGPRDRTQKFTFEDVWSSQQEYTEFLYQRLVEIYRVLSPKGAIFFHCDRNATHIARFILDEIFSPTALNSEIIWHYRRWSNSRRVLLATHQTIYYYTKSQEYTFNTIWEQYSPSTNVDQILQKRSRDVHGKVVYQRNEDGQVLSSGAKNGVPLGDVWDIPYLNPKAKERTGYPTQKPLNLLERIINISTSEEDWVLDPFCGSGTTLVAANLLGRNAIGIDISDDALSITQARLTAPQKSYSDVMLRGRDTYSTANKTALALLEGIEYVPVHRNAGIDAFLKDGEREGSIALRVQRQSETVLEAAKKLSKATQGKNVNQKFLICLTREHFLLLGEEMPLDVDLVDAPSLTIREKLKNLPLAL